MSRNVADLLERGRAAPAHVPALDAVMGEDWAEVTFDKPRRAPVGRAALVQAHRETLSRRSTTSGGGGAEGVATPGYRPQAVVKMVRQGGASDVRGLKAQMAYLSRDGEQPLHRSERYMGVAVDAEEEAAIARSWQMPPEGSGKADRTSHFIVSFPAEAGHAAAEHAGRAWAEEMFGSGNYGGDSYDYYTAFHTDRDHPHMHVVVHRRGVDAGAWLKVSRRSDLNYDAMRAVLVTAAEREGITLEATNRLERAVHDRPVPDAEYRRASKEGRAPVAPAHTDRSATLAAAALIHHARRFAANARLIDRDAPDQAAQFQRTSDAIARGQALTGAHYDRSITSKEISRMSERVETRRAEVRENFEKLDTAAAQLAPGAERVRYERRIAEMKAESAPMMAGSERSDLQAYQERDTTGRYQGMTGGEAGPQADEARQRAEAQVRMVAERYGVNPEATVERHAAGTPSRGLAQHYAAGEARERETRRVERGEGEETPRQRESALARMHGEIAAIYDQAREHDRGGGADRGGAASREREEETRAPRTAAGRDDAEEQERQRRVEERRQRERGGGRGL